MYHKHRNNDPLNFFDFTLQLSGFPIKEAKKQLQQIQSVAEGDYKEFILQKKKEIVSYHLSQNPFYKNFIGNRDISDWENIPILQKKDLQIPLKKRLSHSFSLKNTLHGRTSGSSGVPLHYAKDKLCHAYTWAGIMNRFGWYGIDFNTSYQARFYGIPLGKWAYKKEQLKDWLAQRHRFPIFDLSEQKLKEFLSVFRKKKFHFINGHTSSIVLFAKFLKKEGLILKEVCPTLEHCMVTSEMLFDDDKKLLQEQLGIPIINEYGASELDLLAFTNPGGEFQMNSELAFIEVVDDHGKQLPNGTPGKIVVTMLHNKAHPFIRYEVGDIGVLSEKSTPKKPILKELLGRTNDNAHLPKGTIVPGHTFYYVTKTALGIDSPVKEFIVEQNTLNTFTLVYVSDRDLDSQEIQSLNDALYTYLKTKVILRTQKVAVMDRTQRGKLKQFVSKL